MVQQEVIWELYTLEEVHAHTHAARGEQRSIVGKPQTYQPDLKTEQKSLA